MIYPAFRGSERRPEDGRQFVGFADQCRQLLRQDYFSFSQQFEPERAFIRFLQNNADFRDELRSGASAAGRPIISRDGGARTQQLFAQDLRVG